tara:strand:- start:315 stop:494 length:180 start_codon:yes stop_codon:yes gene_type:complete
MPGQDFEDQTNGELLTDYVGLRMSIAQDPELVREQSNRLAEQMREEILKRMDTGSQEKD